MKITTRRRLASMSVAALTCALAAAVVTTTGPAGAAEPAVVTEKTAIARAAVALSTKRAALAATEDDEFHVIRTIVDPDGASHVRYSRTYRGLPVYGGDIVVHNLPDGSYAGSSVGLGAPLRLDTKPVIASKDAAETARRHFSGTVDKVGGPVLVVDAVDGVGRLAYETVVSGVGPDKQTPSVLHVLVDAAAGEVIRATDEVESIIFDPYDGTGNTLYAGPVTLHATYTDLFVGLRYRLIDQVAGGGTTTCDMNNGTSQCSIHFPDEDGIWGDGNVADRQTAAADAHYGAGIAHDYFKSVHGRDGVWDDGRGVTSRVHFGNNVDNAFWNGSSMTYGDGWDNQHPFVSLDIVGHEMTHGVTQNAAGLVYKGESGGLNEASSDIFGTMIEFHAANPYDPGDYEIGEKAAGSSTGGGFRRMYNPFWYSCYHPSLAFHDPHEASGPANHFFFNLAEGSGDTQYGFSPLCGNAPPVKGIGRKDAEQIWFRALNAYFISNTSYVNADNPPNTARAYTLTAAADIFGRCSAQVKAVHAAWVSVNVPGDLYCFNFEFDLDHLVSFVGESSTVQIQTSRDPDTDEPVTLAFTSSGLPEGARATFEPAEVRAGDKLTMIIHIPTSARPGSNQVTARTNARSRPYGQRSARSYRRRAPARNWSAGHRMSHRLQVSTGYRRPPDRRGRGRP